MGQDSKLMLLGGIMINVDGEKNDMFAPQTFKVINRKAAMSGANAGEKGKDLMSYFDKTPSGPRIKAPKAVGKINLKANWKAKMTAAQGESVTKHFPTALPGSHVEQMVFTALADKSFTPENTVYTESSCPDELNHDSNDDISNQMANRWGEIFPLGGLAGIPFTGKTGWGAFSHHVPDNGNILALYAPHVGITKEGVVGKIHRPKMSKKTTACGASIGAYNALDGAKKEDYEEEMTSGLRRLEGADKTEGPKHDHQISYIIEQLRPQMGSIQLGDDFNEVMANLAYETYHVVKAYMDDIVDTKWMSYSDKADAIYIDSKVACLGGIMINMDGASSDLFIPLNFGYIAKDGTMVNLMEDTFGAKAVEFSAKKQARSNMVMWIIIIIVVIVIVIVVVIVVLKMKMIPSKVAGDVIPLQDQPKPSEA